MVKRKKETRGRKRKVLTDEQLRILERLFRSDASDEEALEEAEINPSTYYEILKRDPDFRSKMRSAQRYPFLLGKKLWVEGMQKGDIKAAIQFLRHRQSQRYNTRVMLEMPKDPIPIQVIPFRFKHPFRKK